MSPNDFPINTISGLLHHRAAQVPNSVAHTFPEKNQTQTWAELWREVQALARGLLAAGIGKADRVVVLMEGCSEVIQATFAVISIGAVVVPLNPASTEYELERYFRDAAPALVLAGTAGQRVPGNQLPAVLAAAGIRCPVFVLGGEAQSAPSFSDLIELGRATGPAAFGQACRATHTHDPAFLLYTSGTTGEPKGVVRSTASFLLGDVTKPTEQPGSLKKALGRMTDRYTARFVVMSLLPLYHLGGIGTLFTSLKVVNVQLVLLTHFNPVTALQAAAATRCKFLIGTPYMIQAMLGAGAGFTQLTDLVGLVFTSAAVSGRTLAAVLPSLPNLYFFTVSYGSSEAGSVANGTCVVNPNRNPVIGLFLRLLRQLQLLSGVIDFQEFNETPYSIGGRIDKRVEVQIRDLQTGAALPPGQTGEILIRSQRVMRYAQETLCAAHFLPGGWYKSGDLGYLDARGYLVLTGRTKRLISRGGEKISPVEIEDALLRHAGIADALVVGVPDALYGEQVCAAVVAQPGTSFDAAALRQELAGTLARFKVPRYVVSLPALPVSATGKIASEEVKNLVLERISANDYV